MNVEEAYQKIAERGLFAFEGESWEKIIISSSIADKMVSSEVVKIVGEKAIPATKVAPMNIGIPATEATLFLRDDLLKTTGDRIWTMTMTIESNGKFDIQYGYEKPEDWE